MKKKEWPEKMVKAWGHRIEEYRDALWKGEYGTLFSDQCYICAATYEQNGHGCMRCPFEMSSIARSLRSENMFSYCFSEIRDDLLQEPFNRKRLEARLQELIDIGRETGVIK